MAGLMRALAAMPRGPCPSGSFWRASPQRKRTMLWEIEKTTGAPGRRYGSFLRAVRILFPEAVREGHTVVFEGPGSTSLDQVSTAASGAGAPGHRCARRGDIRRCGRVVCGPRGFWRAFQALSARTPDVRQSPYPPWWFFSLTDFLARRAGPSRRHEPGTWPRMGRAVVGRRASRADRYLESIPMPHRELRASAAIERPSAQRARLSRGDVDRMFGTSIEFPTRTGLVIHRRTRGFSSACGPLSRQTLRGAVARPMPTCAACWSGGLPLLGRR
jgi:hypothetical protein